MLSFENQNIEFKQEYVPDIRKEVMGFANAYGGTVYVGVRKDGAVLGIDDLKEVGDEKLNALGVTDIESGNTAPRIRIVKESYILDAIYIVTVIATMGYNLNH